MVSLKDKILPEDQDKILKLMKEAIDQIDYVKKWNQDQIDLMLAGKISEKQMKKQLSLALDHVEDSIGSILEVLCGDYVPDLRKVLEED